MNKSEWRARLATVRRRMSTEDWTIISSAICDSLRSLPEARDASTIHAFWPSRSEPEVDLRPLIREWTDAGKKIVLPVVIDFSRRPTGKPRLIHRRYAGDNDLITNRWGLDEPVSGRAVATGSIDLVIVPALGADQAGTRIGHGFGYYDEWLAESDALTVCVVPDVCLVDRLPSGEHDVRMQIVASERRILRNVAGPRV